jgi:hypothetical protein
LESALYDFPEVWARLTVEARQRFEVRIAVLCPHRKCVTMLELLLMLVFLSLLCRL